MGKNSGGVTDWHKKQHKKQLAKNKEARITARDERVVQEKTVQEVRAEIRKLEQQYKNEEQRPHTIQSKLDRLKKELKLVTAKEETDKRLNEPSGQKQKATPKPDSYVPLQRPEVSVYFDAVMNPFGAPPPGQPKMYFRRGGGTTMNLNEACTPQEQFLPPPPPPPPPARPIAQVNPPLSHHPSPPPPPPPSTRGAPPQNLHHSRTTHNAKSEMEAKPMGTESASNHERKKAVVNSSQLPSLPAPSTAVARMKQNRLAVDIWASQEEIDYEEQVSATNLEGVVGVSATAHSTWFYKDMSGTIQGPFTTEQMCQWNKAGYFPNTTLVSGASNTGPWKLFREIKLLNDPVRMDPKASIAAKASTSFQDRIAALRQNTVSSHENVGESSRTDSVQDDGNDVDYDQGNIEDSVHGRIAALKAQSIANNVVKGEEHDDHEPLDAIGHAPLEAHLDSMHVDQKLYDIDDSLMLKEANESDDDVNEKSVGEMTVQGRIAALRAQHLSTVSEEEFGERSENHNERIGSLPLPPPPPPKASAAPEDIPLYPVDDIVPAYPIDPDTLDELQVSYPYDDHEYPVTGDYGDGSDEYPVDPTDNYLMTDPYTVGSKEMVKPPKKKVKVDQAVRALVPSRLRKR